jgi:hypothetical protein
VDTLEDDWQVEDGDELAAWRGPVEGTLYVYFDRRRRKADALPASFIHPTVPGSVVCVLGWYYKDDTRECNGFVSFPDWWLPDGLLGVLGRWIAGGHVPLGSTDEEEYISETLCSLVDVRTAVCHATSLSFLAGGHVRKDLSNR